MITPEDIPDVNERLKAAHYSGIPCTVTPAEYWNIVTPNSCPACGIEWRRNDTQRLCLCPITITDDWR